MASSPAKNKTLVSTSSLLSPSIPSKPNFKPRNSETGDLMRRSFRGNPFPPGREINRVEFGDKENQIDKNQFSNVVKSPKGSKNFMSPTISAVSKINPSPRKKILSEKNEVSRSFDKTHHHQVRSSVSFSDVISIIGEDKDEDEICFDEKKQLNEDDTVENHGIKNTGDFDDSSFQISPLPPSVPYTFPVFEAHEEDPSVAPPYDPKKNYLSPRPQFLHYRPNPRIQHHSDDECKQLEELFISESSSSDTDLSAEESQQEEEVASQEGVVAVEEEADVVQEENDKEHLEAAESDEEEEEEVVVGESTEEETHQIPKQSRFKMSKLLGWILALGVAYFLLVSSTTLTQPNIIQDSPFYKFHISAEITKSARLRFEQLSEKLGMWAGSSLVYMDKLISSLQEEEGYGPFQFHNLTDVLEDIRLTDTVFQKTSDEISVAGLLVDSQNWSLEMDIEEGNGVHQEPEESENGGEIDIEADYKEDVNEFEQESERGEVNSEMVSDFDKQTEIKVTTDTEMNGGEGYSESLSEGESGGHETDGVEGEREHEENLEKVHESETRWDQNDENNMEEAESDAHQLDDATISGQQQEVTRKVLNPETLSEEGAGEIAGNSIISAETTDVEGNDLEEDSGIGEVVNAAGWEEILLRNQKKVVALISTVTVMLAAAAAFLLAKKKTKPVMLIHEDDEPKANFDTKEANFEPVPVENLIKERLSSLNFQEEDKKIEVSSFPSEMSFSFHKNKSLHSCNNVDDDLKENQSRGGGGRKSNDSGESMASSASEYSIGSVSYGSFTTYEKIQKKVGRKEEEMVTPVRRSSRIRNHQHSGQ